MANNGGSRRKCYTFIWKLENVRYWGLKERRSISSPAFAVDEIEASKWRVGFVPRSGLDGTIVKIVLFRLIDDPSVNVEIDSEIAFVAFNGAVLFSDSCRNKTFDQENNKFWCRAKREDVFPEGRSSFNFRDTLIVRCKIWKSEGEISKDVQCIARTLISVQKTSFIWKLENFSTLELEKKYEYDIKSLKDYRKLMCLRLSIKRDKKIDIVVSPEDQEIKFFSFDLSIIDGTGNTIEGLRDERWSNEPDQIEQKSFCLSKTKLTEKKNIYLPNDVLSLKCKCVMSFGIALEEIEGISSDFTSFEKDEMSIVSDENIVPVSKEVLNESFKSLLSDENESPLFKHMMDNLQKFINNGALSDIKLRTSSKTLYFANMFILSARSPVFKDMFSGEINHIINGYVDIDNLEDDTLSRILQFIYKSEVEQLEWSSAIKLYIGADTYKIPDLKVKCSSYLKTNLSRTNACEALQLADQHQDEDLKCTVQNFILRQPKSIISSKEFGKLMEENLILAAETMRLIFMARSKKSGEKGKKKLSGNQKKRKLEEDLKSNTKITSFYQESKNIQANAVPSCSFTPQLPLDLPKEPDSQRELEKVDLIRESSTSSMETVGMSDDE